MGGRFLFRNTNMSTLFGLRLALFFVIIFPEVKKFLSEGTEVAGVHNSCLPTLDRMGSRFAFVFHHSRAVGLESRAGIFRKWSSSPLLVLTHSFSESLPKIKRIALSFLKLLLLLVGAPSGSVHFVQSVLCLH